VKYKPHLIDSSLLFSSWQLPRCRPRQVIAMTSLATS